MNAKLIFAKFARATRRDGLWKALQLTIGYLKPHSAENPESGFDARYGTNTDERVPLWDLKINSPNAQFGVRYEASDERVLEQTLNFMKEDPAKFTFIDLGCGKGRALLLAWKSGFKKILGVEFAPELAEIAEENLRKVGAVNASVIRADAADFSFPDEDFVAYLFNPFSAEVMRSVVDNLRRSKSKRRFVIYNSPYCAEVFDSSGFLTRMGYVPERQYPTIIWSSVEQTATNS